MRRTRDELLALLEPSLGAQAASALVDEMYAFDPSQLATKMDLAATREELRDDLGFLRAEVAEFRGELRTELRAAAARIDERYATMTAELTATFRGELLTAVSGQTRAIVLSMLGTVVAVGGLALGFTALP